MLDSKLTKFAERYTEAWCSGVPERVAEFYAQDGSLTINDAGAAVGREMIAAGARGFMQAFPDMRVEMDRLVEKGGRVEYHWTLTGTNTGKGGTGKRVRISGFESWKMGADGLIAESLGKFDEAEFERQVRGER